MFVQNTLYALAGITLLTPIVAQSPQALVTCLSGANVTFTAPGDPSYASTATPFNLRLPYAPAAIAAPTSNEQVSAALLCAASSDIKVQARGGGHSYADFSLGGADGSLIIDLVNFSNIDVDDAGTAIVGAGQRLGNIAIAINDAGRALPHGSCPGVGIGGHAIHGGYGYASRRWGLTLDTITALDVALPDGRILHVTEESDADGFFALRGAAESYGVVTSFHFATQPAPESTISFTYAFGGGVIGNLAAVDIMCHLTEFALNASVVDERVTFGVYMDQASFSINGIFFGDEAEFRSRIQPELLRGLPNSTERFEVANWIRIIELLAEGSGPLVEPLGSEYPRHDDFFAKSIFAPEDSPITHDAWLAYFNYMNQQGALASPSSWFAIVDLYGGPGSAVTSIPSDATAFVHRDALFSFQHYGFTSDQSSPFPTNISPFIEGLNAVIPNAMPETAFGAYSNYIDPSLSASQAHELYYGANYQRLLELKGEVDPAGVMWNPQAIGVQ